MNYQIGDLIFTVASGRTAIIVGKGDTYLELYWSDIGRVLSFPIDRAK